VSTHESEQLCLFEVSPSLGSIREACEDLMQNERAVNTVKAYSHCWQRFANWCSEYDRDPLPASAETVRYFVGWCLRERPRRLRLNTVRINLAAIKHKHRQAKLPLPFNDELASLMRSAARKLKGVKSCKKEALTMPLLERMLAALDDQPAVLAARDRSILLFGIASGWRRSEMSGLHLSNLRLSPHEMKMRLGASKTDQEGVGREIRIPEGAHLCPVQAMRTWLKVRGDWPGPLYCAIHATSDGPFRIVRKGVRGDTIADVVKRALERVGEDPDRYGAHSMRAALVTIATENGANLAAIKHRTGHKSLRTLMGYIRLTEGSCLNPLKGVL
jgi:integrase